MENYKDEISDWLWQCNKAAQMPRKQKILWQLRQDIQLFEDLKRGGEKAAALALWILEGPRRVDRIIGRDSLEFMKLESASRSLFLFANGSVKDIGCRLRLPVIDSVLTILKGCKAKVESWTDDEAADNFSATVLPFPKVAVP